MKKKLVIGIVLMICIGFGVCGTMGLLGMLSTRTFQATTSPTLSVSQVTPIETPTIAGPAPSLTPLPGQVGVRPSQTAYSLTRTAYPTDVEFYTSVVSTKPIVVSEGTATKFIKTLQPLLTKVKTHPTGTTGICNDGTYTSVVPKQDACHYNGGIYEWWGPTPVK